MMKSGWILLTLSCVVAAGCQDRDSAEPPPAHDHAAMQMETGTGKAERSGHSIFHLDSEWTTAEGSQIELSSLGDRTRVMAMVYTSCEVACPRIIADMRAIKSAAGMKDEVLGFVLVSIDPERDTPRRLTEFAEKTGLSQSAWTLLSAEDDSVRELAAVLGVRYRRIDEFDFAHSNIISVLNRKGEVVHQQIGLEQSTDETVAAIHESIRGF